MQNLALPPWLGKPGPSSVFSTAVPALSTGRAFLAEQKKLTGYDLDRQQRDWRRNRVRVHGEETFEKLSRAFHGFEHRTLYGLTPALVEKAAKDTDHALGESRPNDGRVELKDFSPPYPFVYLFHFLLERFGRVFLWQDFVAFVKADPGLILLPFAKQYGLAEAEVFGDWEATASMRALQFRLGCAYYSFLREIYVMATLREVHGMDVRYHVLLDVEFKIDMLVEGVPLALYIGSKLYKDGNGGGRKVRIEDRNPARRTLDLTIIERPVFGKAYLVGTARIAALAAEIRAGIAAFDG